MAGRREMIKRRLKHLQNQLDFLTPRNNEIIDNMRGKLRQEY